jgi:hypothetical protein
MGWDIRDLRHAQGVGSRFRAPKLQGDLRLHEDRYLTEAALASQPEWHGDTPQRDGSTLRVPLEPQGVLRRPIRPLHQLAKPGQGCERRFAREAGPGLDRTPGIELLR